MRICGVLGFVIFVFLATAAGACTEASRPDKPSDEILVEIKILPGPVHVGDLIGFELRITNTSDRPIRFLRNLDSETLPSLIDSNGRPIKLLCEIVALDCESLSIEDSVLLMPGSFYGCNLYAMGFGHLTPGVYGFGASVFLQGCAEWPFAINENIEVEKVQMVVQE